MADSIIDTDAPSAASRPVASTCSPALTALIEAQVMSESIRALVERLLDEQPSNAPTLEAVIACTNRLDAAVVPVIERGQLR